MVQSANGGKNGLSWFSGFGLVWGSAWLGLSGGEGLGGRGRLAPSLPGILQRRIIVVLAAPLTHSFSSRLALLASPLALDSKTRAPFPPVIFVMMPPLTHSSHHAWRLWLHRWHQIARHRAPSVPGIKCLEQRWCRAQMGAVLKAAWLGLAWGSAWRGLTGGWGLGWRKCSCSHHRCHGCSLAVLITPGGTGITIGLR